LGGTVVANEAGSGVPLILQRVAQVGVAYKAIGIGAIRRTLNCRVSRCTATGHIGLRRSGGEALGIGLTASRDHRLLKLIAIRS